MNTSKAGPGFWMLLSCLCLMKTAASGAEPEPANFWKRPTTEVPSKLVPAKVELLAEPDLTRPLALFDPDHKVTNPAVFPFVNKDKDQIAYRIVPDGMVKGSKPFSDRHYTITALPERFARLPLLQTKMSHKGIVDSRYAITLSTSRPTYLFLAVDERLLTNFAENGAPGWLQEFAPTGEKIAVDNPFDKAVDDKFQIFVKKCPAGRIVLGPCGANPKFNSMYFTFFAEAGSDAK